MRHNFLYGSCLVVSSSKPLHQRNQLEQIFEAKETSVARHCYEWIFRHDRGPTRRNRVQLSRAVVEVHPILAPVVAVCDQLELPTSQRVVRMGNLEAGIGKVTMRCS